MVFFFENINIFYLYYRFIPSSQHTSFFFSIFPQKPDNASWITQSEITAILSFHTCTTWFLRENTGKKWRGGGRDEGVVCMRKIGIFEENYHLCLVRFIMRNFITLHRNLYCHLKNTPFWKFTPATLIIPKKKIIEAKL